VATACPLRGRPQALCLSCFLLGTLAWERLARTALEDVIAADAIRQTRRHYAALLPDAKE